MNSGLITQCKFPYATNLGLVLPISSSGYWISWCLTQSCEVGSWSLSVSKEEQTGSTGWISLHKKSKVSLNLFKDCKAFKPFPCYLHKSQSMQSRERKGIWQRERERESKRVEETEWSLGSCQGLKSQESLIHIVILNWN